MLTFICICHANRLLLQSLIVQTWVNISSLAACGLYLKYLKHPVQLSVVVQSDHFFKPHSNVWHLPKCQLNYQTMALISHLLLQFHGSVSFHILSLRRGHKNLKTTCLPAPNPPQSIHSSRWRYRLCPCPPSWGKLNGSRRARGR